MEKLLYSIVLSSLLSSCMQAMNQPKQEYDILEHLVSQETLESFEQYAINIKIKLAVLKKSSSEHDKKQIEYYTKETEIAKSAIALLKKRLEFLKNHNVAWENEMLDGNDLETLLHIIAIREKTYKKKVSESAPKPATARSGSMIQRPSTARLAEEAKPAARSGSMIQRPNSARLTTEYKSHEAPPKLSRSNSNPTGLIAQPKKEEIKNAETTTICKQS